MSSLWEGVRPLLGSLAAFSFIMNLLFVVPALFMLQVFDRVLPSNSRETLLVLLAGTGVALLILFVLDCVRNRLQHLAGNILDLLLHVRHSTLGPYTSGEGLPTLTVYGSSPDPSPVAQ